MDKKRGLFDGSNEKVKVKKTVYWSKITAIERTNILDSLKDFKLYSEMNHGYTLKCKYSKKAISNKMLGFLFKSFPFKL